MNRQELEFANRMFQDEAFCREFLINSSIFSNPSTCIDCFGPVSQKSSVHFKCTTKNCRKLNSIYWGTPFASLKLKVNQIMELFFLFNNDASTNFFMNTKGNSSATISKRFKVYMDILVNDFSFSQVKIGGENVIVECDESKFGKRKYHRGHRVEGVWVFGLVERTPERRLVVRIVEKRDAATLLPIIRSSVLEGSIVLTDCWRAYNGIQSELGLAHETVNHSENFVEPITLNHTNTIEGTWNGIKMKVPARKRTKKLISNELVRFSWNRQNKDRKWGAFLNALARFNIE